jgi:hypothetical protein
VENTENLRERQNGNDRRGPANQKPIRIDTFRDYNYEGFGNGEQLHLGDV